MQQDNDPNQKDKSIKVLQMLRPQPESTLTELCLNKGLQNSTEWSNTVNKGWPQNENVAKLFRNINKLLREHIAF